MDIFVYFEARDGSLAAVSARQHSLDPTQVSFSPGKLVDAMGAVVMQTSSLPTFFLMVARGSG